ncbi:hypothetical protein H5410_044935 [Solanum commersonii]|uniref:DUF4283 domain-containing protein n=1 Tax=Solanum commersonii TaxID=4109 RepID=A0A9J5XAB3_SOLCO|nr:hypothetical protein H5410_044935 [Solanum commersonii]
MKELGNKHFLSKCLVGRFNDHPFHHNPKPEVIQKWFVSRWQVTVGLKVTPINHNLFLFDLPSVQEAKAVKAEYGSRMAKAFIGMVVSSWSGLR